MRSVKVWIEKVWNENISVGLFAADFFSVGSFLTGEGRVFRRPFSRPKAAINRRCVLSA